MNFYAQYLCSQELDYAEAQKLFDKSLYTPDNDDMAQTLFLYSQCMYKQGKRIKHLYIWRELIDLDKIIELLN